MSEIRFIDTTIRDGHQSLWAESMTTGMMLSVADRLDRAGFEAIELLSGSHVKKAVRELKEDPWQRIRLMAERITETPLRVIVGRVVNMSGNSLSVMENMLDPGQHTRVDRRQIQERAASKISLMPSGLLDTFRRDEILDLLAFLRSGGDPDSPMFRPVSSVSSN